MNMGFYMVVFDIATDQLWPKLGLGAPFRARNLGPFAAEAWVNYVREVHEGMPLSCTNEVLGYDSKRLLAVHRMHHASEIDYHVAEAEELLHRKRASRFRPGETGPGAKTSSA